MLRDTSSEDNENRESLEQTPKSTSLTLSIQFELLRRIKKKVLQLYRT